MGAAMSPLRGSMPMIDRGSDQGLTPLAIPCRPSGAEIVRRLAYFTNPSHTLSGMEQLPTSTAVATTGPTQPMARLNVGWLRPSDWNQLDPPCHRCSHKKTIA